MPDSIDPFANPKKNLEFFLNAMEFVMIGLDNGGNEDNNNDGPQPKRQRAMKSRYTREDQANSIFSVKYLKPFFDRDDNIDDNEVALMNVTSREGKEFRKGFRVPYVEFLSIYEQFMQRETMTDAVGCSSVDCGLLVLGSLRFLTWAAPFKQLEELTEVSEFTHRRFFLDEFLPWGCRLARQIIFLPRDDAEYDAVESVYREKGLPGCVGSVDCVHVDWDRCPAGFRGECVGKSGTPTLAFEVVAAHDGRIQSVSAYNPGAQNDKTIAQNDEAIAKVRQEGTFLSTKTFQTQQDDGTMRTHHGSFYICDGGYCQWTCLIPPFKDQTETSEFYSWSKHVEGLRKDIECVFGKLKRRFHAIKNPIRFGNPDNIQRMFVTCCALHNALLKYDNTDNDDDDATDDANDNDADDDTREDTDDDTEYDTGEDTDNEIDDESTDGDSTNATNENGSFKITTIRQFNERRQALVDHYNICIANGSLNLERNDN